MSNQFSAYLDHGWVLTPIKSGTKGAYIPEWSSNKSVNATTLQDVKMLNGAAGLCLAFCKHPILSVDIDDWDFAVGWFNERDIDIAHLLGKDVAIKSPSPNKAKLLYKLDEPFITRKVMTPEGKVGIEFRCATSTGGTLQDVLPPSPYYDKQGNRIGSYEWSGGTDWGKMPMVPPAILEAAQSLGVSEPRALEISDTLKVGDTPIEDIDRALRKIPPAEGHDHWIKVGMAIHSEHPTEEGLATWLAWSAEVPEQFDYDECLKRWSSFKQAANGVTLGTLFGMVPKVDDLDFGPLTDADMARLEESKGLPEVVIPTLTDQVTERLGSMILVPGNQVDFNQSATSIYGAAQEIGAMYRRGGVPVVVSEGQLVPVDDVRLIPLVDSIGKQLNRDVMGANRGKDDKLYYRPQRLSRASAQAVLKSDRIQLLDEIKSVSATPFITADGEILRKGYHPAHKVYVIGGEVADVDFNAAVPDLLALFDDFATQSDSDMSRLMAALITPALKPGGMVVHSPIHFYEADQSQAGKGLAAETPALVYGTVAANVKQRSRGVGSLEEAIDSPLAKGKQFINLDNLKGRLDSGWFEGLITAAPNSHETRIAYHGYATIDTTAVNWAITSNGLATSPDLVNRINYIKLRKQPSDYKYVHRSKDGYHAYVKEEQPYLLGCVMAVVKRWIRDGKPMADPGGHTFIEWASILNHMVTTYFKLPPLMADVAERKEHLGDPVLSWARLLCLAVDDEGMAGHELRASDLCQIIVDSINGADEMGGGRALSSQMESNQPSTLGRKMKVLRRKMGGLDEFKIDHFTVKMEERQDPNAHDNLIKFWTFLKDGKDAFDLAGDPLALGETPPQF